MLGPIRGQGRVCRSHGRRVRYAREHFRDIPAPDRVVAGELAEPAVDADVLDGELAVGPADVEVVADGRGEERARAEVGAGVGAGVDRALEDRVGGRVPAVLEVGMARVADVVAGGEDKGAVVVLKVLGVRELLEEDGHEADGVGRRAGAALLGADRVRDVVLEVGARGILAVPAGREEDLDADTVGAVAIRERERLRDGCLVEAQAVVVERLVRRIRAAHRAPRRRASDHAETGRELHDFGLGTAVQVVHGPVGGHELKLASIPVLVVQSGGPVVGFVVLDFDGGARALAESIEIVGSCKIVATDYIVDVLAKASVNKQTIDK